MAEQVKVTSIEALESFRANVIIFLSKAHRSVDEVGDEIRRTRQWLSDQRMHWEGELRRRTKVLDEARSVLLGARMSGLRDSTAAQENAVRKAKEALHEAEDKIRNVKQWSRNFDNYVDPLTKGLEGLRYYLDHDMPKGLSYLVQAQTTLEAYTESARPEETAPAPAEPEAKELP